MSTPAIFALSDEQLAFMQQGVSITVSTCDAQLIPSVSRALGCKVSPDRLSLTLYVSKIQATGVLRDIALNGKIAVVFSEPPTHRTIQVKGKDARVTEIDEHALSVVEKHEKDFAEDLLAIGFSRAFTHGLLHCPASELVAVTFTPASAFSQTPGPKAGERLDSAS